MQVTEKMFQTPELAINYAEGRANGPAMLLLHGRGAAWQDWEPVIEHFQSCWHIFAPDLRGCGGSEHSPLGNYAINDFVDDINRFIKDVVVGPVVIIGHSLGAIVTIRLAAQYSSGSIRAVALEDPPLFLSEFFREWVWFFYYQVCREILETGLKEVEAARVLAKKLAIGETDAIRYARNLMRIDPRIIYQTMEDDVYKHFQAKTEMKRVTCPLLMLYGEWDLGSAVRPEDTDRVAGILRQDALIQIQGAGHGLHLAKCRPTEFNRLVGDFLARLATAKS